MKRIYTILGLLIIATAAMAYLYFSKLNSGQDVNDNSLRAVTKHCSVIFAFENDKSFYDILSGQNLVENILGEVKSKQFKNLKKQFIDKPRFFGNLNGQRTYIGFTGGDESVDFLIASQLKTIVEFTEVAKWLDSVKLKNSTSDIYELTFADSTSVYLGLKDNLVLISSSKAEISKGFQKDSEDVAFTTYISSTNRMNKNNLANLYLNFNKIPELLGQILSNRLSGELDIFNKQNSYAALTYNFSTDKLLFNGTTTINDDQSYYNLFSSQTQQKIEITSIIPNKSANYTLYSFENYKQWYIELTNWFAKKQELTKIEKNLSTIDEKYRLKLTQTLPKYFKNQFVTFQLASGEKFGAVSLNNGEKVNQILLDLSNEYATDIRVFREPEILYYFFGEPFKKFDKPFYTIIDNYLVIANNASSIQSFLASYSSNQLLINDSDYINFNNQFSSTANISFYVNNKNSNNIFGRNLKGNFFKQYQSVSGFKKFNAFCYQLSGDKGKFLSNLILAKSSDRKEIGTIDTNKVN